MTTRVLITGATGFVGANLARALAERGDRVRVLRRATSRLDALADVAVEFVTGDILEPNTLAAAMRDCDVVYHVAALSQYWRSGPELVYQVNVEGTRNVLQAALAHGVPRLVYTSSVSAIGYAPPDAPADESQTFPDQLQWFVYGHSKHLAELEVQQAVARGLAAVIVNPGIVLGPRDVNFVSGSLIRASVNGQLRIVPPGGSNIVHVADVVAGHIAAAERGRIGERYILGGENLSHRQAASIIAEVTGGPPPVLTLTPWLLPLLARLVDGMNRRSGQTPLVTGQQIRLGGRHFYVRSDKAIRELGLPQTPFRQAVVDAYAWYCDHGWL
jgi:dihydroflavonol-4-reductase